jgi:hypothetical protein
LEYTQENPYMVVGNPPKVAIDGTNNKVYDTHGIEGLGDLL